MLSLDALLELVNRVSRSFGEHSYYSNNNKNSNSSAFEPVGGTGASLYIRDVCSIVESRGSELQRVSFRHV